MKQYRLTPERKKILEAAAHIMEQLAKYNTKHTLSSPAETRKFLRTRFSFEEREKFIVLWLDSQHRVIEVQELFAGTIDGAAVYPREVVKAALQHNAAACILSHNHPSGLAEPSNADKLITDRIVKALDVVDVRVLDHVVVGNPECVSFAERGLL